MNEWQPIETAPTNTSVLILNKNGIFEAHAREYSGLWWFAKDPSDGGGVSVDDDPTHWMPLPELPKGEIKWIGNVTHWMPLPNPPKGE